MTVFVYMSLYGMYCCAFCISLCVLCVHTLQTMAVWVGTSQERAETKTPGGHDQNLLVEIYHSGCYHFSGGNSTLFGYWPSFELKNLQASLLNCQPIILGYLSDYFAQLSTLDLAEQVNGTECYSKTPVNIITTRDAYLLSGGTQRTVCTAN